MVCLNLVLADLVITRFHFDGHDFPVVLKMEPREDVPFENLLPSPGKLLRFRCPHFAHCHQYTDPPAEGKATYSPSARIGNSSACRPALAVTATR